jgi:glycosyltransferase involved in cell wall biosynthesis
MAMVAQEIGNTRLIALGRGDLWKGASQFDTPVERAEAAQVVEFVSREQEDHPSSTIVVWISKGYRPLDRISERIRQRVPSVRIVLDLDDHDADLARMFRAHSSVNAAKLNRLRRGHPQSIEMSQRRVAQVSDGFTFSTDSLRSRFPDSYTPSARIPHARADVSVGLASSVSQRSLTIGALGTIRPHKGGDVLLNAIRSDPGLRLVTFAHCGLGEPGNEDPNWVELPAGTPLAEAYSQIDVSVILMTDQSQGAQLQLPAKLVDSMRAGVAILASPTPAISEIAGDSVTYIANDDLHAERLIGKAREAFQIGGSGARKKYLAELTPSAVADQLSQLLATFKKQT